jgi:hypothetical protein
MSTFNRLFDLAAKALDKNSATAPRSGAQSSGDWRSMVRSAAESLTGDGRHASTTPPAAAPPAPGRTGSPSLKPPTAGDADRAAIARYDCLMQTADPHQIERIHQEAFARLTPAQRAQIEARMRAELPPYEQPRSAEPADLARAAARSEAMQPGRMRGLLARTGGKTALVGAGAAAGGVLGLVAGGAIASAVAVPMLAEAASFGIDFDAIASGLDLDALSGGALDAAGEHVSQIGEQVSGFGESFSDFGLGDLFGR